MQRSRRALLQRRAFQKSRFYKVSLSLVFVLWGLALLLTLWIHRGDGYTDGSGVHSVGISAWDEEEEEAIDHSDFVDKIHPQDSRSVYSDESACTDCAETISFHRKVLASEGNADDSLAVEKSKTISGAGVISENTPPKVDRSERIVPVGLDEFKSRVFSSRSKSETGQAGGVIHRVEPGGKEYNYASASKGAKVLDFNKEAKGATNILGRDKDKYLRNPCSAEEKFVAIELSEETLVDTVNIANFEHYSSNLKEFELLGSLVYPTDGWEKLGDFIAANVKHAQRFVLQEPKWVRYLKLNLLSHHGSEFYCTLSAIEVYGVDAVERMLEDLISSQDNLLAPKEGSGEQKSMPPASESNKGSHIDQASHTTTELETSVEKSDFDDEVSKSNGPVPEEVHHQQVSRIPGDSVLKILMQKVHSLDASLSVLERYVEEVNSRHTKIFNDFDKDLGGKDTLLEKISSDIKSVQFNKEVIDKDVADLISWKSHASLQLGDLFEDKIILRSKIDRILENQASMENKSTAVFLICMISGLVATVKLLVDIFLSIYAAISAQGTEKPGNFCGRGSSWFSLLLSSSIIMLILAF